MSYSGASLPQAWMRAVCSGSVGTVLAMYTPGAVLLPTYSKTDLPGAGTGVLRGRDQLVHYFRRFMGQTGLCGSIDTEVVQRLGSVTVCSGLYTFWWQENGRRKNARARYTYVVVQTPAGPRIVTHHSSAVPS